MLKKITIALFIFLGFLLQSSVFSNLALGGISPNIMIVITAAFGFMYGDKAGTVVGFASGLLIDIFFGSFLGFYAFIMMYIGFINGKFNMLFYPEDIKLPIALIVTSDLSFGIICYILMFMLRGRLQFSYYLMHVILPETLYTICVTIFLYPVILFVNRKLENREVRRS